MAGYYICKSLKALQGCRVNFEYKIEFILFKEREDE